MIFLGYRARYNLARHRAASFIQRCIKRRHLNKLIDTVMAVVAMKRIVRIQSKYAVELQRCIRGFITRRKIVRYLQYIVTRNQKAATIVSRALRRWRDIMWRFRHPPVIIKIIYFVVVVLFWLLHEEQ